MIKRIAIEPKGAGFVVELEDDEGVWGYECDTVAEVTECVESEIRDNGVARRKATVLPWRRR